MQRRSIVLANFREAPPASTQSRALIHDWRIIQFDEGRTLVGFLENGFTCRITTAIVSIDIPGREVRTSSGRLYELLGPPACEPERLAVIAVYVALSLQSPSLDVTGGVWDAMCKAIA